MIDVVDVSYNIYPMKHKMYTNKSFKEIYSREMKNLLVKTIVYTVISAVAILATIILMRESPELINWNVKETFFRYSGNTVTDQLMGTVILFITGIMLINFLVSFITKVGYFFNKSFFPGFFFCFLIFILDIVHVNIVKDLIFPTVGLSNGILVAAVSQLVIVFLKIVAIKFFEKNCKNRFFDNIIKFKNLD